MHSRHVAIVAAVRSCIGTRFRPQGRDIGRALDCVGVALVAAEAAGMSATVPPYAIGGDHDARRDSAFAALGCTPASVPQIGDLLVLAPAEGRRHVAIVTPGGIVHAHAGLRRVVEGPLDPAWPVVAAWRFPEKE